VEYTAHHVDDVILLLDVGPLPTVGLGGHLVEHKSQNVSVVLDGIDQIDGVLMFRMRFCRLTW
jgi:hypothetical protein